MKTDLKKIFKACMRYMEYKFRIEDFTMIFSEIYSVYYITAAKIVAEILSNGLSNDNKDCSDGGISESELTDIINKNAFSESILAIPELLNSEKWQFIQKNQKEYITMLKNFPSRPLSHLEKRWLKAVLEDPRIKLFNIDIPELRNTIPLFTNDDYMVFDKYSDGDPFNDEAYIERFRLISNAIHLKKPIEIEFLNKYALCKKVCVFPLRLEYSAKDDKFRLIVKGRNLNYFNLGRITSCSFCSSEKILTQGINVRNNKTITISMEITDRRNALERVMLHFAHFDKHAKKIDDDHYIIDVKCSKNDELELVIRVLSFGPFLKVIGPDSFIELIRKRLKLQKELGLR